MKPRTVIISDLHLGGGAADPGDDHVYQGGELAAFVTGLADSETGRRGDIELFINGDFLEFAQTNQAVYASSATGRWCNEAESVAKLKVILAGHAASFAAIGRLAGLGNRVTIAAGNHDVDLYWPRVQAALRKATHASVVFETGEEWSTRHGGRLQISHGHLPDPANTFRDWRKPVAAASDGDDRLELCAGTLFMLKFVNGLESRYPFADNLQPVQRLAKLLARDEKSGFFAVSWAMLKFAGRHPVTMKAGAVDKFGSLVLARIARNQGLAESLCAVATAAGSKDYASVAALRSRLVTELDLAAFIIEFWPQIEASEVRHELTPGAGATLGVGSDKTLAAIRAAGDFGKNALREVATRRVAEVPVAEVVVMGHTHIPDECEVAGKAAYFNPGSWTRYLDLDLHPRLALDDLRDESRFPYSLQSVQVDLVEGERLRATRHIFREFQAEF